MTSINFKTLLDNSETPYKRGANTKKRIRSFRTVCAKTLKLQNTVIYYTINYNWLYYIILEHNSRSSERLIMLIASYLRSNTSCCCWSAEVNVGRVSESGLVKHQVSVGLCVVNNHLWTRSRRLGSYELHCVLCCVILFCLWSVTVGRGLVPFSLTKRLVPCAVYNQRRSIVELRTTATEMLDTSCVRWSNVAFYTYCTRKAYRNWW